MKKTSVILSVVSLILLCALTMNLVSCVAEVKAQDLMEGIEAGYVEPISDLENGNLAATDFALNLFKNSRNEKGNSLVSPLSVLCALAMTANGAEGETLSQMESVLGMSIDDLNRYIYSYNRKLSSDLSIANSIWFTADENFTVNEDFLHVNADYYGADAYKSPFNEETVRDINKWVKENTDGMIPEIIGEIPRDAVMFLVNAIALDAKWNDPYEEHQVKDGKFTKEDGTVQDAEFMHSYEDVYLESNLATGFTKPYRSGLSFVALLPKEGVSVAELVDSLDGKVFGKMFSEKEYLNVVASMPRFETEFEANLNKVLKDMGMTYAFDLGLANFTGLGTSKGKNIFISEVLHKTTITVNESGTKAAAVTSVEMDAKNSAGPVETKIVHLDRPFVYMIVDNTNNVPIFIGTMMDVEG